MRKKLVYIFLAAIVFLSCQNSTPKYIYNEGFIYGTIYHIVYESPKGENLKQEIERIQPDVFDLWHQLRYFEDK